MPHNSHNSHTSHTGSSGDDLGSTDEVKIFKDEGDREDEKISSENLLEEKSSLIDLTESEEKSGKGVSRQDHSPVFGKVEPHASSFNMGYLVSPYTYTNGAGGGLPVSMANKMGLSPFFCHNGDPLTTPPPAHCGIPPYQLDPKAMGLTRPAIYPFPASQYPYSMLSPDMSQVASWHTPSVYSAASSFRSPYPSSLPINTTLSSDFPFRFSPSLLPSVHTPPHHVLNSHPAIVTPGPKQEIGQDNSNHRYGRSLDQKNSPSVQPDCKDNSNEKKKPHIKKPLNAFMLYMKEMRAKVVAECTLKESAAINQILGRRWHALGREEQAKYYELARRERQLHMQMYPDWSSRTNASRGKKRKRKQDTSDGGNNMKKCRARFGLDQQNQWCKPCSPGLPVMPTTAPGTGGSVLLQNSSSSSSSSTSSNHLQVIGSSGVTQQSSQGPNGGGPQQPSPQAPTYVNLRKKKCIRYMEVEGEENTTDMDNHVSDDNLGSCGSVDEAKTPEDDTESLNQSLSSPGCLSGLSSLQSPSTSLASPLNLLTSPSTPNTINSSQEQHHSHHHHQQQHPLFSENSQNGSNINNSQQLSNLDRHRKPLGSSLSNINNNNNNSNNSDLNANGGPNKSAMTTTSSTSSISATTTTTVPSILASTGQVNKSEKIMQHGMGQTLQLTSRLGPLIGLSISERTSPQQQHQHPGLDMLTPSSVSTTSNNSILCTESPRATSLGPSVVQDDEMSKRLPQLVDEKTTIEKLMSSQRSSNHQQQNFNSTVQSSTPTTGGGFSSDMFFEKTIRNPVGANPRDVNNPLSINQLTKRDYTVNNNSPSTIQNQGLHQQHSHHQQSQQHHLHMINAASPSSTISSSSTSSSSLSSSSMTSNDIQPTSGYTNLTTTTVVSSTDVSNHQFSTPALTQTSNTHQQQQHHQHYQLTASAAAATAVSPVQQQQHQQHQQQNHQQHHHSLALSQHLQQFTHHFPTVTGSTNQNSATKPTTPSIATTATSTSTHHRTTDNGDNGAISVT